MAELPNLIERTVYFARKPIGSSGNVTDIYERGLCILLVISARKPEQDTYSIPSTFADLVGIHKEDILAETTDYCLVDIGNGQQMKVRAALLRHKVSTGQVCFWIDVDEIPGYGQRIVLQAGIADAIRLAYQTGVVTKGIRLIDPPDSLLD